MQSTLLKIGQKKNKVILKLFPIIWPETLFFFLSALISACLKVE